MDMSGILESYLTEQAKRDEAFAAKFDSKKMGACVRYVVDKARKHLKGRNGAVEDTAVYKWARDFFNDGESKGVAADKENKKQKKRKKVRTEHKYTNLTFDFFNDGEAEKCTN